MNSSSKNIPYKPKPMAELIPYLHGICDVNSYQVQMLTAKKKPHALMVPHTIEKTKILTMAELKPMLDVLNSVKPKPKAATSTKKLRWDTSVKVNKTKSHTADGQMKLNSVRKMLNFQAKPQDEIRTTMNTCNVNTETPKFPKPESKVRKTNFIQNKNSVRVSGVCKIAETPTFQHNKDKNNLFNLRKKVLTPKLSLIRQSNTPLSNASFKSNGDSSFLQMEQEINDIEKEAKAAAIESAEVPPPASTPFKQYRDMQVFFNDESDNNMSILFNNTIMSFDETGENKENVIRSLCDKFNKVTMDPAKINAEVECFVELEKFIERNLKVIDEKMDSLNKIKALHVTFLQYIKKFRNDEINKDDTQNKIVAQNPSPILRPSVIKMRPPTYKIHKNTLPVAKKLIRKSIDNASHKQKTPEKKDEALDMYMKLKENMNFLNTPNIKRKNVDAIDTPTVTSNNLQIQLNRLYNES